MTQYMVADGHDAGEPELSALDPQPRSNGIQYTRRTWAADRTVVNEGPYTEWVWNIVGSKTDYDSILSQMGLDAADKSEVFVKVKDDRFGFVNKNGTAHRPVPGDGIDWSNFFPRNVVILITDLEDPS